MRLFLLFRMRKAGYNKADFQTGRKEKEVVMSFSVETGIPVLTVFLQGLLSFFSPCVLPLVPLYVTYLSGGAKVVEKDGTIRYPRGKVLLHTLCFVIGISFAFFALGFGFSALGRFFSGNRTMFARISGILMILFGIYQTGILGHLKAADKEHRIHFRLDKFSMNPLVALVFGFTFSFAWTPCVGPALASVLLMVSTAASPALGYLLIGVYTAGFVIPFLAVGLFTGTVLDFFRKHQKIVRYSVKGGAVLMILLGVMTFTGWMNGLTGYLSSIGGQNSVSVAEQEANTSAGEDSGEGGTGNDGTDNGGTVSDSSAAEPSGQEDTSGSESGDSEGSTGTEEDGSSGQVTEQEEEADAEQEAEEEELPDAPDFTLTDQYGNTHTLSEYRGKTVFLNFWATWCGPCKMEMPDIQALFEEYGENSEDLIVLGVANPKTEENPGNADESQEDVEAFLEENGYTYPVAMDTTGEIFQTYGISAFPTTFMITEEGKVFGYASGTLTSDMIHSIVEQTMTGVRE